jgi:phage gp46-like protein
MTDIRFLQQKDHLAYAVELDWLLTPLNLLAEGAELQSAVIVALGSDALAGKSEVLPDLDSTDRRGWWGDMDAAEIWGGWPVGSKLWLLTRTKIMGPLASEGGTVARADAYTRAAMRPFTEKRITSKIDVAALRTGTGRIDVDVVAYRGPEPAVALRYAELWGELGAS